MSSIKPTSFNYSDFTVADLNTADVFLKDNKRCQGIRYTLMKLTPNGQETKTVVFQDLFQHLQVLTKKTVKEEEIADKSKPYIKALNEIKDFIPKLEAAEEASRKHYDQQGVLFKIFTAICRVFGKTPWKGTHADRLTAFKDDLDKYIANMKAGHNLALYAEIEAMIDKNKDKKQIFIKHHKKFPKASGIELEGVLYALDRKGKLADFIIYENHIKIDLPDLKIYDEIEEIIDNNEDVAEILIDRKKFPTASTNELHSILNALKNNGKLVDFSVYKDEISIEIIKVA